jgi:hypothetical protein
MSSARVKALALGLAARMALTWTISLLSRGLA